MRLYRVAAARSLGASSTLPTLRATLEAKLGPLTGGIRVAENVVPLAGRVSARRRSAVGLGRAPSGFLIAETVALSSGFYYMSYHLFETADRAFSRPRAP